jgi:hypothetical protein
METGGKREEVRSEGALDRVRGSGDDVQQSGPILPSRLVSVWNLDSANPILMVGSIPGDRVLL